jgi:DNA-directed RNA polymerase I subunit RPA1
VWLSQTHRSLSSSTLSSSSSRERGGGARSLLAFSLMDSAEVLRHTVRELSFGFFGAEEVRGLSVKQVTSPQTFDVLGHALPGGLYDPAMGPAEKSSLCDTCGLGNADCPGHLGHIELPVPVYHPLLFAHMFRILRAKCLTCHKLKCSRLKALKGLVKLGLLDAGEGEAARNLDKELLTVPPRKKNRRRDLKRTADQVEADAAVDAAVHADEVLSGYQKKLKKTPRKDWLYSHDRALRRELVEAVLKSATGNRKCENCGAHTRSLRREGTTKIFQKPLSDRARQASEGMERPLLSALEALEQADDSDVEAPRAEISDSESGSTGDSGSESDSGSSDNDHSSESPNPRLSRLAQDKYMAPSEVEAQLRLLWEEDSPLLHALFGKAGTGMCVDSDRSGYCMFFLRVLPVPPTRFRPPGKVGDIDTEHPQNVHLSKVLELSERLQEMMGSKGRSGAGGSDESMSR